MSWVSEAFSYFRRLALLDDEVKRTSVAVEALKKEVGDHGTRLVRIETLIDMTLQRRGVGSPPRLPRR